jgi:hypothetical protein
MVFRNRSAEKVERLCLGIEEKNLDRIYRIHRMGFLRRILWKFDSRMKL